MGSTFPLVSSSNPAVRARYDLKQGDTDFTKLNCFRKDKSIKTASVQALRIRFRLGAGVVLLGHGGSEQGNNWCSGIWALTPIQTPLQLRSGT